MFASGFCLLSQFVVELVDVCVPAGFIAGFYSAVSLSSVLVIT